MTMQKICAFALAIAVSGVIPAGVAFADDISNNLDATIDANLEVMNLTAGGATGSAQFNVTPQNGDGKNGCNLTAGATFVVSVTSSNSAVATVAPSSVTFKSCGDKPSVTVTPLAGGSTNITLTQISNTTGGTFNLAPASFTVNITGDTIPPTLHLPSNMTVEATGPGGTAVSFSSTADDANPIHPVVSCLPVSGSTFALGATTVNCSATDAAGNTANGSFQVTVVDTTPPVLSGTPSNITMEATGPDGVVVSYTNPTASDLVDGLVPVSCAPASGSNFALGDTTVHCGATDSHGNTGASSFHIVIMDTTAPVLVLPSNITTEATSASGAPVSFAASAIDVVDGAVPVICDHNSGDTFPLGHTTISCSATDSHTNSISSFFDVFVEDTTPPAIIHHADVTAEATFPDGAAVDYALPTATDAVDGDVVVTCSPLSGSTLALGHHTITCTATDHAGNAAHSFFDVFVEDTTPPVIATNPDMTLEATGSGGAVATFSNPVATDLVDTSVDVVCSPVSGGTFALGHTQVTCTGTDDSGNAASSFFDVFVEDTTPPAITPHVDMVAEATSPAGAMVTYDVPTASDLVDGDVVASCNPTSGSTFPLSHTKVACTATDVHGNTAHSFFDVFVEDTIAPVVSCDSSDGLWHAGDVSLHCSASDSGSGLASPADTSFTLSTNVPASTENSNALTDSRTVCDVAGNCTTAGPIAGNKVDKLAPLITVTTPVLNASYTVHQSTASNYGCTDNGSGVALCIGPALLDTSLLGPKTFTVHSTDNAGNISPDSKVPYKIVAYTFGGFGAPLTISKTDFKKVSTIPVKFRLFDTLGNPVSNAVATLRVCNASDCVDAVSSGGSNVGNFFRYDPSARQYIFNLSTKLVGTVSVNTLTVTLDDGTVQPWTITIR